MGRGHRERPVHRRWVKTAFQAGAYAIYVSVLLLLALELSSRVGILKSRRYLLQRIVNLSRDKPRVLILGDSFLYESYKEPSRTSLSFLLREYFDRRGMSVLNLALPGIGLPTHLELLERWGTIYSPDVILLGYYVGNDISDTEAYLSRMQASLVTRRFNARLLDFFEDRTYFGQVIHDWRHSVGERRAVRVLEERIRLGEFEVSPEIQDLFLRNLLLEDSSVRAAWEHNQRFLLTASEIAERLGSKLFIFVFPATFQVNRSHYDYYRKLKFRLDDRMLTQSVPQDHLLSFCRDHSLQCFDLLPMFREKSENEYYLTDNDHWNEEGNALVFESVRVRLEEAWIP